MNTVQANEFANEAASMLENAKKAKDNDSMRRRLEIAKTYLAMAIDALGEK